MNKKILIILGIFFVLAIAGIVALRLTSAEDTWLCQEGVWVRHGNPSTSAPASTCPR